MITYGEVFAGIGAARAAFGSLGWYDQYVIEKSNPALAQYLCIEIVTGKQRDQ